MSTSKTRKIVIHSNPDVDAVACVVAARQTWPEADVEFIRINQDRLPQNLQGEDVRVLDHNLGDKGKRVLSGRTGAAVCNMPESKHWDPFLLAEIDEQDQFGSVKHPRFSLASIMSALKQSLLADGVHGREVDEQLVQTMGRIIRGLNQRYNDRVKADMLASTLDIVQLRLFKMAILPLGPRVPGLNAALSSKEVACAVYQHNHSVGVIRFPGFHLPDLTRLEHSVGGPGRWYVHPAGFLASWGTAKAPVFRSPPEGTPQSRDELVQLMIETY